MTEPLDPLKLPLNGSALIEASAGTGKTWTIAALLLRLVLGHGATDQQNARPLLPAQILVMTFTRAATRELRDRIRQRLVEAVRVFRGSVPVPADDRFLAELLAAYPAGPERESAAWRLETAAQAMDEAAVFTLDAWCQKVLRESAFASDAALQTEVVPDSSALRLEAARDVWRQEVYPLNAAAARAVQKLWRDPDAMAKDARLAAEKELPADALAADLATIFDNSLRELADLKAGWAALADEMQNWLMPIVDGEDAPFSRKKITPDRLKSWLDALRDWAADPGMEKPALTESNLRRLTANGLNDALNKDRTIPTPPACFDALDKLVHRLDTLAAREPRMRAHAAARIEARLQELKRQRLLHSHMDVQRQLHDALDEARHGARARSLRDGILQRYPAALVDEFQDTSPLQLGILDRLYRVADDDPAHLLLLIGDPKQSIYAFRGADIHSYLRARQATAGRHFALDVNHRSTSGVVSAVNELFQQAEARPGDGAFRFGSDQGERRLPFEPVRAKGRQDVLLRHGAPVPALTMAVDAEPAGATDARQRAAERCARALVELLSEGECRLVEPGKPDRALRPGDIAVLVRTSREAMVVRDALASIGLPSVFLSDRDSVFQTADAADLLRVLRAVAAPRDVRLARAALATTLLGLSLRQLQQLAVDDEAFDRQAERLARLLPIWQGQGVLAVVRALLHSFDLPARWLSEADGERRLTDVLHLGELLQAEAAQREGLAAQLGWLARRIDDPLADGADSEEQVLRLESDADRVQVVTIHKSKGLEYPVVFMPFGTQARDPSKNKPWALWLADDGGERRLVMEPSAEDRALALREEQREDLRLLYVALTRARHALWVGASIHTMGNSKDNAWHRSALGYLVSGDGPQQPDDILAALGELARAQPAIQIQIHRCAGEAEQPRPMRWNDRQALPPLAAARSFTADFDRSWSISSYSALVRDAAAAEALELALPAEDLELRVHSELLLLDEPLLGAAPQALTDAPEAVPPWHRFPRGALAGNFLHLQLQWLAGEGFALSGNAGLQADLLRRCERDGWGHRAADVQQWLAAVCERNLPPLGAPLRSIRTHLSEMEFWLPSNGLDTARLDTLCREHLLPGQPRPELAQRTLRGLLMGFADLILEHQGRFWVLDYKSNALGTADSDYSEAAIQRAILEHRYDVQAALYLLPVHRLLRQRLGERYEPQRMLGGAIILFLRGVASPTAGCESLRPPLALLESLDVMLDRETEP